MRLKFDFLGNPHLARKARLPLNFSMCFDHDFQTMDTHVSQAGTIAKTVLWSKTCGSNMMSLQHDVSSACLINEIETLTTPLADLKEFRWRVCSGEGAMTRDVCKGHGPRAAGTADESPLCSLV